MTCPVCGSANSIGSLVKLPNYPIYQHPIAADTKTEPPYHVELDYEFCSKCGHGFHNCIARDVMERMYQTDYFTTPMEGVGTAIFDSFRDYAAKRKADLKCDSVLEIASSFGEALLCLREHLPNAKFTGFEPNQHAASVAEKQGLTVHRKFFNPENAKAVGEKFDLVFARHLIEHIFDLEDFMNGFEHVTHDDSKVLIETPCLDWSVGNRSVIGLSVEHVQFFSLSSLEHLFAQKGWLLNSRDQTDEGNMILVFSRAKGDLPAPAELDIKTFQETYSRYSDAITEFVGDEDYLLWGAGSGGNIIRSLIGRPPAAILDGNPNKSDKIFAGLDLPIQYSKDNLEKFNGKVNKLVVASLFIKEIRADLEHLNWKGETLFPLSLA